jgi:FlaA1/EpsC-like NDP-sugar epimerase
VIADVKDPISMNRVFETYRPSVVFHTAAHKHVPLMQSNTYEAILNNVGGTMLTAELAVKYGVKKFILISTDKAVKPTSIMGATKRVCEQIASSLGQCKETEFAVVRFGNVLGSRGSLIPVIKAQIRRGGPVKVTHRDMKRFFMTIPEAVQLIVQAGAIGKKGEIFILDMGEPVRIYDLVVDLIRLHGLEPGEDIAIQFTGIRPGEKVDEELVYERESLRPTKNTKINEVVNLDKIDYCWLKKDLETLYAMCRDGRLEQATQFLMELAWGKSSIPAQSNALEKKSDFFTGGQ